MNRSKEYEIRLSPLERRKNFFLPYASLKAPHRRDKKVFTSREPLSIFAINNGERAKDLK